MIWKTSLSSAVNLSTFDHKEPHDVFTYMLYMDGQYNFLISLIDYSVHYVETVYILRDLEKNNG